MRLGASAGNEHQSLGQRLWQVSWSLVLLFCITAGIGFAMLYSASQSWDPWASRQAIRFSVCIVLMLVVAVTDIRFWMHSAYVIYGAILALLAAVELIGMMGMGAQRWIDLGLFQLQPSEIMKIAIVLALARYFHGTTLEDIARPVYLIVPLALVAAPVVLVLRQPDLGTAVMLLATGGVVVFLGVVAISLSRGG